MRYKQAEQLKEPMSRCEESRENIATGCAKSTTDDYKLSEKSGVKFFFVKIHNSVD